MALIAAPSTNPQGNGEDVRPKDDLYGDQRLRFGDWGRLEVLLWCRGEILALVRRLHILLLDWLGLGDGRRNGAAAATNQLLGLGRVVPNILLCGLGGSRSVMAGELLDLFGLLVDDMGGILDVVIDELLVGLVDEWGKEEDGGRDERHAPKWDNLDQVVRDESRKEGLDLLVRFYRGRSYVAYSRGSKDILRKDNALRFNDEEVDELSEVAQNRLQCLL